MPKMVTVEIDESTAEFSVDLTGFHGKGCAEITKAFESLGRVKKSIKKPEYLEKTNKNQQQNK